MEEGMKRRREDGWGRWKRRGDKKRGEERRRKREREREKRD
jgi:hypothetical protein